MKLAFSTLGCPDWTWKEIFSVAKDLKMNGVEIRGLENEMYAPKTKPFVASEISKTMDNLKKADLTISMLTSGACLADKSDERAIMQECEDYIDLAQEIGAKYVRVLISGSLETTDIDFDYAVSRYRDVCKYAQKRDIIPLIETNDILADTKKMAEFIKKTGCENSGVLWDVHHPYRFALESVKETVANIGEYIKYVHVKDSVMQDGELSYRMMGYGDVPIFDALSELKALGYDGFVSLEWVKRWNPDMEEPGIVFAHYSNYIQHLISRLA